MRLVKMLAEQIEDELDGACEYAYQAIEQKSADRSLSRLYYSMAKTELEHAMALHSVATDEIAKAEKSGAKPTKEMVETWEKSHREMVDKATKVKSYLAMY